MLNLAPRLQQAPQLGRPGPAPRRQAGWAVEGSPHCFAGLGHQRLSALLRQPQLALEGQELASAPREVGQDAKHELKSRLVGCAWGLLPPEQSLLASHLGQRLWPAGAKMAQTTQPEQQPGAFALLLLLSKFVGPLLPLQQQPRQLLPFHEQHCQLRNSLPPGPWKLHPPKTQRVMKAPQGLCWGCSDWLPPAFLLLPLLQPWPSGVCAGLAGTPALAGAPQL